MNGTPECLRGGTKQSPALHASSDSALPIKTEDSMQFSFCGCRIVLWILYDDIHSSLYAGYAYIGITGIHISEPAAQMGFVELFAELRKHAASSALQLGVPSTVHLVGYR